MKKENRVTTLPPIGSPEVVAAIDAALAENDEEKQNLVELRKVAVRIHGEPESQSEAPQPNLDLTVAELIERYQTDPTSGFANLRFKTRENYRAMMRRVATDLGPEKVGALNADRLEQQFVEWSGGGERVPMARSLVAMLRVLATYSATVLKSRDGRELKLTLHEMRFERPTPAAVERITAEQVAALTKVAHTKGFPSVALAQALQFDCGLKQKETIGEWIPIKELKEPPGADAVIDHERNEIWVRGITWQQVDNDWVLRYESPVTGHTIEERLLDHPFAKAEIEGLPGGKAKWPKSGPIIISERTQLPYRAQAFRDLWREIANEAGIPKSIKNTDSGR